VDKLAVDCRRPPCIRKVQTVALAVVPGKRDESSVLAERPLRSASPTGCSSERKPSGEYLANLAFKRSGLRASWWRNGLQLCPVPRSTVAIDPESKRNQTPSARAWRVAMRSSVVAKIITMATGRDKIKEQANTNQDDQLTSR
jgi:hypothetical protein